MADVDPHRGQASRRRAIRKLATLMAGSPLLSLVDANGEPVQAATAGGQGGRQGGAAAARPSDRPPVVNPRATSGDSVVEPKWDERLTSAQATRVLLEANVRRSDRKQKIDKLAAQIMLQSYLDATNQPPIEEA